MDKKLNDYLEKIERHLKPLPVSERIDIVKEIQSQILELQNNGKTAEEIVERLGNPKELAKAYLGDMISKDKTFHWNRVLAICAYYSLASFSGLIIIPTLAICAPVFILTGILTLILGAVKLLDTLLNLNIPYAQNIVIISIGTASIDNPFIVFAVSAVVGAVLYLIGRGCWKLLVSYIKAVSSAKHRLSL